jgi:two-component system NtrC family sensor kinase
MAEPATSHDDDLQRLRRRIEEFEAALVARDKTITALIARAEHQRKHASSAFSVFEQHLSLERIVTQKTSELEEKSASLERALAELKEAHASLLQAQKLQSIGQLAAGIAHEINTPMQFILDNTVFVREAFQSMGSALRAARKVLVRSPTEAEIDSVISVFRTADVDYLLGEVPRALDETREGIGRVRSIVTAMRNFAHHDNADFSEIDLNENIRTTMVVARSEWKYAAEVTVELDENLPRLPAMRDELNQVILNLLVNAAQAVKEHSKGDHGVGARIILRTRRDGDSAVFEIADTGGGIPAAVRDRVFEPFFTTKPVGKGTGQGLAIARSVIERHSGHIDFCDNEIGGTTFTVRLPLRRTPQPGEAQT